MNTADIDIATQLKDLSDLSVTVQEYLQSELFKEDYGAYGDYSVNDLLAQCYLIILQELGELGIQFTEDESTLLGDWYTARHIYYLREWLDSLQQSEMLRTHSQVADYLSDLLSQEHVDPTAILDNYVSYWVAKAASDQEDTLSYILPMAQATSLLLDHLRALLQSLQDDGTPVIMPDIVRAKRYIAKIKLGREYAERAARTMMRDPVVAQQASAATVEKLLKDYDLDKTSPAEIHIYATIDLDDDYVRSHGLSSVAKKYLDLHHRRSPHHIEYWLDDTKSTAPTLTPAHIVLLVAHHYEPNATLAEFVEGVNQMLTVGVSLFSPEQVQFISHLVELVGSTFIANNHGSLEPTEPKLDQYKQQIINAPDLFTDRS